MRLERQSGSASIPLSISPRIWSRFRLTGSNLYLSLYANEIRNERAHDYAICIEATGFFTQKSLSDEPLSMLAASERLARLPGDSCGYVLNQYFMRSRSSSPGELRPSSSTTPEGGIPSRSAASSEGLKPGTHRISLSNCGKRFWMTVSGALYAR